MPADPANPNFFEEFQAIQGLVACPACAGELCLAPENMEPEKLVCAGCGAEYPVVNGIPVLTPRRQ